MNREKKSAGTQAARRNTIGWIVLAAGVLLIVTGCLLGQPDSVLAKAIRICLECVGIG